MTFLQPTLMLWMLPAVGLPLLIHLLNRLRFRQVRWAAMLFLVSATRSSTRRARLRQYLIMLCRMLAILFIALALGRPSAGGWLAARFGGAPDTVLILLDRSASMETVDPRLQTSKRARALEMLAGAMELTGRSTRYVLIENVLREPQEVAGPGSLPELSLVSATDTAADLPAMLRVALDYLIQNRPGRAEIWIASDLQSCNWRPESGEWQDICAQLAALPQQPGVRVIELGGQTGRNVSLSLKDVARIRRRNRPRLLLSLDLTRESEAPQSFPLIVTLDGVRSASDVAVEFYRLRVRRDMELGEKNSTGWGQVEIPADANRRDNVCYFTFGQETTLRSAVVSDDPDAAAPLRLAAAPDPARLNSQCDVVGSDDAAGLDWRNLALVAWQASDASSNAAAGADSFVRSGGRIVLFPPGNENCPGLFGLTWGGVQAAKEEAPYVVSSWDEHDGPLARTAEGENLPLAGLAVKRRQAIALEQERGARGSAAEEWHLVAAFPDGRPFLLSRVVGNGTVFACVTLPLKDWSNLDEGPVLVPMIQRMAQAGGERLAGAGMGVCGTWRPASDAELWQALDTKEPKDHRWNAGIYRFGERLVALNRPACEDEPDALDKADLPGLFGGLRLQVIEKAWGGEKEQARTELWRVFVLLALAAMLAEMCLLVAASQPAGSRLQSVRKET